MTRKKGGKRTLAQKALYTAPDALVKIAEKIAFTPYDNPKNHATISAGIFKGEKLWKLSDNDIINHVPVHVSVMTGKLEGLLSISTACTCNQNCVENMKDPDSPCHMCFAAKTLAQYTALREHCEANLKILNNRVLTDSEIDVLCRQLCKAFDKRVRIEFCGDIETPLQGINYLRIIEAGKAYGLYFGVWTKLLNVWKHSFEIFGNKPENMTFIYSAPSLNQTVEPKHKLPEYWFVDCVFIVCDKEKYEDVKAEWIESGYNVHDCKCENGSCANNEICGYCFNRISRRIGNKPTDVNIILEVLRK